MKFTTITPSFRFKNRLMIERASRSNHIYVSVSETSKSFTWSGIVTTALPTNLGTIFKAILLSTLTLIVIYLGLNFDFANRNIFINQLFYSVWNFVDFVVFILTEFCFFIASLSVTLLLYVIPNIPQFFVTKSTRRFTYHANEVSGPSLEVPKPNTWLHDDRGEANTQLIKQLFTTTLFPNTTSLEKHTLIKPGLPTSVSHNNQHRPLYKPYRTDLRLLLKTNLINLNHKNTPSKYQCVLSTQIKESVTLLKQARWVVLNSESACRDLKSQRAILGKIQSTGYLSSNSLDWLNRREFFIHKALPAFFLPQIKQFGTASTDYQTVKPYVGIDTKRPICFKTLLTTKSVYGCNLNFRFFFHTSTSTQPTTFSVPFKLPTTNGFTKVNRWL